MTIWEFSVGGLTIRYTFFFIKIYKQIQSSRYLVEIWKNTDAHFLSINLHFP